jgi:hypothetical protein
MNQVKFQYNMDTVEFFIHFKGVKVIVMRAKLQTADFNEFKRLHGLAKENAADLMADLRRAA